MNFGLSDCHGDLAGAAFCCFRLVAVAIMLSFGLPLHGELVEAKQQAERTLSDAGLKVGFNANPNVFAAIGVFSCDVKADMTAVEEERLRQKGVKSALLDAKGKLVLAIYGHSETTKEICISDDSETFRVVCKAFADTRLRGYKEFPCSESWSEERRIYKVAIPVSYKKGKNPYVVSTSGQWDKLDSTFLSAKINALDDSQRIGCVKWDDDLGQEYIVAFGSVCINGKAGKALNKCVKKAELMALGNLAFWLGSDVSVRVAAEDCIRHAGDESYGWERFSETVLAQCEHKSFPHHEVASGTCTSPITKKRSYWCALGAKLVRSKVKQ